MKPINMTALDDTTCDITAGVGPSMTEPTDRVSDLIKRRYVYGSQIELQNALSDSTARLAELEAENARLTAMLELAAPEYAGERRMREEQDKLLAEAAELLQRSSSVIPTYQVSLAASIAAYLTRLGARNG